jgi:broad specificity phosphatase PhoE
MLGGLLNMLVLVRHTKTDAMAVRLCGRKAGIALSAEGKARAAKLAQHLSSFNVDSIFSSSLQRALQTADVIAETTSRPVRIDARLDEIDFGEWTGRTFSELAEDQRFWDWNRSRAEARAPGGESMREVQERVAGFLQEVTRVERKGTLVAVSHGDVIKSAVCHVLGLSLNHYDRFEIDPGSFTTLLARNGRFELLSLNEGGHG